MATSGLDAATPKRRPTAVVAALREEIAPLVRKTHLRRRHRLGGRRFISGLIHGAPVVLTWTGVGRRNTEAALAALLEGFRVRGLVGLGLGGALSPGLEVGSLVVARDLRQGGEEIPTDPSWLCPEPRLTRVARAVGLVMGTVATVDEVVDRPAAKAALWQDLGQPPGAAVDMESAYLGREARRRDLPFLIVRAISDGAQEGLPCFLHRCRDPQGGVDRWKVVGHALTRPQVVPSLLILNRRLQVCARRLAEFMMIVFREDRAVESTPWGS